MRKHGRGLATGFKALDKKLRGLRASDFMVVSGESAIGKTALALDITTRVTLSKGRPSTVAFVSPGASKKRIMNRLIASTAGVNLTKIQKGYFPRERWEDLAGAAARFAEAPLYIDDSAAVSLGTIRTRIARLAIALRAKGKRLSLVIIDQLEKVAVARVPSEQQPKVGSGRDAEVARQLKAMAVTLNVAIIAFRKDSGAPDFPTDADIVVFLSRGARPTGPAHRTTEAIRLIIAKNRRGTTGTLRLRFSNETASFLA